MKLSKAIEILEAHNKWRRCDDDMPQTFEELGHTAEDIGIAIDTVVDCFADDNEKVDKWQPMSNFRYESNDRFMFYGETYNPLIEKKKIIVIDTIKSHTGQLDKTKRKYTLSNHLVKPTHWKPLPEPPKEIEK